MSNPDAQSSSDSAAELAESIAARLEGSSLRIAVAESLTGGQLSMRLAAAPNSSNWFSGGLVAYMTETKHRVLNVSPGPVVSARAAEEMASGIAKLTGANLTIGVTGVGGPDEQDGREVGTVFIGVRSPHGEVHVAERMLGGSPEEIVESAVVASLRLLDSRVDALASTHTARR
ncbi:CinA family protein [Mycetocola zhadangensis]|jgi:nicotinamide-nucleotide amidase|uniref:CinA family protein n=1 Tax=Mycetocola zhadangensis TaxID=1164595 RepID=UPI003A4D3BBD